jgi:hypothetical protein
MSDIINLGLQIQRSYDAWVSREFPDGNIPADVLRNYGDSALNFRSRRYAG